jgi:hypothetical protein
LILSAQTADVARQVAREGFLIQISVFSSLWSTPSLIGSVISMQGSPYL